MTGGQSVMDFIGSGRGRPFMAGLLCLAIAGCGAPVDPDLRDVFGNRRYDTSEAALRAIAPRPEPDARGVISYPSYQVAVARPGETVREVAGRLGVDAIALARYNGVDPDHRLRAGEILALPERLPASGTAGTTGASGAAAPADGVNITEIASAAIDDAEPTPAPQAESAAPEPIRHRVEKGETAYSIARLYRVPLRVLAEWNSLGPDFAIREGQYLLIPTPPTMDEAPGEADTAEALPPPPSAAQPLPATPAAQPVETVIQPPADTTARASSAPFVMPVEGAIIRTFEKGGNEGIDIAAPPGTPVRAAADGEVGAVTSDVDNTKLIVLKHAGNILTVYINVDDVAVKKGDRVRKGEVIAKVAKGTPSYLHFEVREGFEAVDPERFLP